MLACCFLTGFPKFLQVSYHPTFSVSGHVGLTTNHELGITNKAGQAGQVGRAPGGDNSFLSIPEPSISPACSVVCDGNNLRA